jgi:16S rRNA (cytosine967-C5)-methyltransferase
VRVELTGRELARAVLERVELSGAFANRALSAALDRAGDLPNAERGLATELVYGVLRRRARLERALEPLATRGLSGLEPRVRIALWVGAYQILFLDRVPAYAAVSEAVEACKRAGGPRIAGFANALLRRLADKREPPFPDAAQDPLGHIIEAAGFPPWLARLLLEERPADDALAFARATLAPAPLALRANSLRATRAEVQGRLGTERAAATLEASPLAPDAILARNLDSPAATTAWLDGLFAIEDTGAQVMVELCGAAPGERILDACAGLGGKSAHLAALSSNQALIEAVDNAPTKLDEAKTTFKRLGVTGVTTAIADLTRPLPDATPRFHRILLDAPCSGLGVLRRHPEALQRRTAEEIPALAARQLRMLEVLAPLLLPGGALTYSVCTFERAECDDVIATFLRGHPGFRAEPPPSAAGAPGGVPWERLVGASGFVRTWPERDDADAFFAARLVRYPAT